MRTLLTTTTIAAVVIITAPIPSPVAEELGAPGTNPVLNDVADGTGLAPLRSHTAKGQISCIEWGARRPYVAPRNEWRRCRARGLGPET